MKTDMSYSILRICDGTTSHFVPLLPGPELNLREARPPPGPVLTQKSPEKQRFLMSYRPNLPG